MRTKKVHSNEKVFQSSFRAILGSYKAFLGSDNDMLLGFKIRRAANECTAEDLCCGERDKGRVHGSCDSSSQLFDTTT